MGPLGAESGLVTVTGLLWDCDVSPGTQRGEEANKERDEREVELERGNHRGIDKEDLQR